MGVKHQFQHIYSVIYYIIQREVTDKLYHTKSYPKNCETDTGDEIYLKSYMLFQLLYVCVILDHLHVLKLQSSKWKFEFTGPNQILEFIYVYIYIFK